MPFWGQLGLQEGTTSIIEMLNYFHDYMIVILTFIIVFVTYIFVRIIATSKVDKYTMDSHTLETVWTVVPMVILLFIAFPSLYLLYLIEDVSNPAVTVKVVGHQWYWEYQYSNSWANFGFDSYIVHEKANGPLFYRLDVDNRLILPTLSQILFLITSADVIHSWTVPTLGIKTDAIPGRLNFLSRVIPFSGVYFGQCREICGSNHSFMPIVVEAIPSVHFINYVEASLE